jgi:hypothetical protein
MKMWPAVIEKIHLDHNAMKAANFWHPLYSLDYHARRFPAADADGGKADALVLPFEGIEKGYDNPRTAGTNGMPQCDSAAKHI